MAPTNLTEGELRTLQLAWQAFKTMPEVDYEKLAELGGWKNKATACVAFCKAKKKLLGGADDTKAPKATKGKKRATPTEDEDEDEDQTPAPKKKRGKKAKQEAVVPTIEEENEDEELDTKKKTIIKQEKDVDSVVAASSDAEENLI